MTQPIGSYCSNARSSAVQGGNCRLPFERSGRAVILSLWESFTGRGGRLPSIEPMDFPLGAPNAASISSDRFIGTSSFSDRLQVRSRGSNVPRRQRRREGSGHLELTEILGSFSGTMPKRSTGRLDKFPDLTAERCGELALLCLRRCTHYHGRKHVGSWNGRFRRHPSS